MQQLMQKIFVWMIFGAVLPVYGAEDSTALSGKAIEKINESIQEIDDKLEQEKDKVLTEKEKLKNTSKLKLLERARIKKIIEASEKQIKHLSDVREHLKGHIVEKPLKKQTEARKVSRPRFAEMTGGGTAQAQANTRAEQFIQKMREKSEADKKIEEEIDRRVKERVSQSEERRKQEFEKRQEKTQEIHEFHNHDVPPPPPLPDFGGHDIPPPPPMIEEGHTRPKLTIYEQILKAKERLGKESKETTLKKVEEGKPIGSKEKLMEELRGGVKLKKVPPVDPKAKKAPAHLTPQELLHKQLADHMDKRRASLEGKVRE